MKKRARLLPVSAVILLIALALWGCGDMSMLTALKAKEIAANTVAQPVFSPVAGVYSTAQTVNISTTTAGATIRYTTDGSTPTSTTGTVYAASISVTASETIKAIAYESGWTDSAVAAAAYSIGSSMPQAQWAQVLATGTSGQASFNGVAVDSSGNGYAAGLATTTGTYGFGNSVTATTVSSQDNVLLVKYNSSGQAQWAQTLTAGVYAEFQSVAVDSSGNVYAAGFDEGTGTYGFGNGVTTAGIATGVNLLLVKYNSSGQAQWAQTLTANASGGAEYYGVAVDSSGNVYAAGYLGGTRATYGFGNGVTATMSSGSDGVLLVKYNSSGLAQWAQTDTPTMTNAIAVFHGVAVDSAGNVYAAGYQDSSAEAFGNSVTATGASAANNVLIVKYNSSGLAQWAQTLTAAGTSALFNGVAADSTGNVYAVGYVLGTGTYGFGNGVTAAGTASSGQNVLLVKYNLSGQAQWAQTLTAGNDSALFNGVGVDTSGNIYAGGALISSGVGAYGFGNGVSATGIPSASDIVLVKYNSLGQAQWAQTLSSGNGGASFQGVAVDSTGTAFAAGSDNGSGASGFGNGVTVTTAAGGGNVLLVKY